MKLLITGAGGFVGAAVARQAVAAGHKVIAMVRPGSPADRLSSVTSQLQTAPADLRDCEAVASVFQRYRPEVVIHTAWSGVNNKARHDQLQINDNITATCSLLNVAAELGATKFVGLGSQGEYGLLSGRISENALPLPTSLYGASKLAALHLTRQLAADAGMSFAWLRLFSTYGPGDNPHWFIPSVIEEMLCGRRPRTTLGTQLWDYLFIDDVARGILATALAPEGTGVFNLGSGRPIKIRTLIERIRDLVDPGLDLVFGEIPYREDQIWHMEADVTRLKDLIGWSPAVDLDRGLEMTIDWHRIKRRQVPGVHVDRSADGTHV